MHKDTITLFNLRPSYVNKINSVLSDSPRKLIGLSLERIVACILCLKSYVISKSVGTCSIIELVANKSITVKLDIVDLVKNFKGAIYQ